MERMEQREQAICHWSENERANKEDKPWLCMIPNLIGIIATLIGIGIMVMSARRFIDAIRRESIIPEFAVTENTHLSIHNTHQYRGHVDGNYVIDGNESDDASKTTRSSN